MKSGHRFVTVQNTMFLKTRFEKKLPHAKESTGCVEFDTASLPKIENSDESTGSFKVSRLKDFLSNFIFTLSDYFYGNTCLLQNTDNGKSNRPRAAHNSPNCHLANRYNNPNAIEIQFND